MDKTAFSATKHDKSTLNSGNQYTKDDQMSIEALNNTIENSLYAVERADTAVTSSNSAVSTANSANTKATNAVNTANSASTTANDAKTKSASAIATANTALSNSTEAIATANSTIEKANNAVSTANSANTKSDSAVTTSNNAMQTAESAESKVDGAVSTANAASSVANTAKTTADNAASVANTALSNSLKSIEDSESAVNTSNSAISKANQASTNANTALENSNTAKTNSESAVATATEAMATAQNALDKVTDGLGTTVWVNGDPVADFYADDKLDKNANAVSATKATKDSDGNQINTTYVKKVSGKDLSSNDFTDTLLTKLNGIAEGATKNSTTKNLTLNGGTALPVYATNTTAMSWYAPTAVGSNNQILKSNGSGAPTWINQSAITAGNASKVANALTFQNSASATDTFNGSGAKSLVGKVVDMFTPQTIGGVKTFSSSPILPTPTSTDNSKNGATTEFVKSQGYLTYNIGTNDINKWTVKEVTLASTTSSTTVPLSSTLITNYDANAIYEIIVYCEFNNTSNATDSKSFGAISSDVLGGSTSNTIPIIMNSSKIKSVKYYGGASIIIPAQKEVYVKSSAVDGCTFTLRGYRRIK